MKIALVLKANAATAREDMPLDNMSHATDLSGFAIMRRRLVENSYLEFRQNDGELH